MLGNCAIGRLRTVREPTSTRTIEITIATIGRLMKNFDMTLPAHRVCGERFWIDAEAGAHFLNSFGNNPVTRIEPTCDHPTPIHLGSYGDRPDDHLVVGIKNCHLIATLQFGNGALRHQQSSLLCLDYCTDFGVTTGLQNIVGIGKKPGEPNCAGGFINLSVRKIESPVVWVG